MSLTLSGTILNGELTLTPALPTWTNATIVEDKIFASDPQSDDYFGAGIAISNDGQTLVVGAKHEDSGGVLGAGAAYVYIRSGNNWTFQQKLVATTRSQYDYFGTDVDISANGDTIIVGEVSANTSNVTVFTRSGGVWSTEQTLSIGGTGTYYGESVALSDDGNTAIVGAKLNNAAYAYSRSGTTWTLDQTILPVGGTGNRFGSSVAISADGTKAAISANFSAEVYVWTLSGTWSEQQILTGGTEFGTWGLGITDAGTIAASDRFGNSVHVFTESAGTWSLQQEVITGGSVQLGYRSLSISNNNDVMVIGSDNNKAFIFTESSGTWTMIKELTASDSSTNTFGRFVTITDDGKTIAIGAEQDNDSGSGSGAAYTLMI